MLKFTLTLFVFAVIFYALANSGVAGVSAEMGRVIFVAFLVPAVIGVSASVIAKDRPDDVL